MSNAANYRTFWHGAQRQTRYKQKHRRAVPMGMGFDICTLQVSSLARVVYKTDRRLMIEHHRNHIEIASALRGCQRRHTPPLTLHCTRQRNRRTWRCAWRYMLPMLYDRIVNPDWCDYSIVYGHIVLGDGGGGGVVRSPSRPRGRIVYPIFLLGARLGPETKIWIHGSCTEF